jgi:hypothetical protein
MSVLDAIVELMYDRSTRERAIALLDTGVSLNAASKELGISRAALREWRDRGDLTPLGRMGAASECFRCGESPRPPPDPAAYAHLLGLYLGDGCVSSLRKGVFSLRITCDDRYPGLQQEARRSIEDVRPGAKVYFVPQVGCTSIMGLWKHWPCLFPQHGPGKKHTRPIVLEGWQREIVERHPGLFLRGLFHSDGCRIMNWARRRVAGELRRYEYPRYFFTNKSEDILGLCGWGARPARHRVEAFEQA